MIRIFISHSSYDARLAEALANLLRTALRLSASEIRCTSVDAYRLPGGAVTDDQLRDEILEAETLIGVMSSRSLGSAYVLFELGARWGNKRSIIPVLAPGVPPAVLPAPLSGLNALESSKPAQLHQLVAGVAEQLSIVQEPASTFQGAIDSIAAIQPRSDEQPMAAPAHTVNDHCGSQ